MIDGVEFVPVTAEKSLPAGTFVRVLKVDRFGYDIPKEALGTGGKVVDPEVLQEISVPLLPGQVLVELPLFRGFTNNHCWNFFVEDLIVI